MTDINTTSMDKTTEKKNFITQHAKIATVIAVVFGATSGIFGTLTEAPSMAIGFWRLTIALPFFAVPILMKPEERQVLKNIGKKDLMWCFISGAFLFGHFFSWFNAVKLTNVSGASVLAALHPLVVLIVTIFIYKQRVSAKSIAAIIVALIGGAIIMGADFNSIAGGRTMGNIFALFAAIFMGLYFAVGDYVRKRVEGRFYVMLVFAGCWICFTLGMILTGTPALGYSLMDYVYIAVMAVLCQIGAHAVFNLCIGHVSSLYVSTWEAGEPVFATLLGIAALGQIPTAYEVIGCIIVVGALLYYNKQENKE